jgi:hypothetical protein
MLTQVLTRHQHWFTFCLRVDQNLNWTEPDWTIGLLSCRSVGDRWKDHRECRADLVYVTERLLYIYWGYCFLGVDTGTYTGADKTPILTHVLTVLNLLRLRLKLWPRGTQTWTWTEQKLETLTAKENCWRKLLNCWRIVQRLEIYLKT